MAAGRYNIFTRGFSFPQQINDNRGPLLLGPSLLDALNQWRRQQCVSLSSEGSHSIGIRSRNDYLDLIDYILMLEPDFPGESRELLRQILAHDRHSSTTFIGDGDNFTYPLQSPMEILIMYVSDHPGGYEFNTLHISFSEKSRSRLYRFFSGRSISVSISYKRGMVISNQSS